MTLAHTFSSVGRILFDLGLVGSHSGNMSVRIGQAIFITRHDAMLGVLRAKDIVKVPLTLTLSRQPAAAGKGRGRSRTPSVDVEIHRAIYALTGARAIVHAHPVQAVALSLHRRDVVPVDVEGIHHLQRVPVVGANTIESYRKMPRILPGVLREHRIAVMRGHGSYAIGATLEEALHLTSALEFSAAILSKSSR